MMTTQSPDAAHAISDELWAAVAPQARDSDMAERRATSRCAAALAVLLVLAAAVHLSGIAGGRLGSQNSGGGDFDTHTRSGSWEANVVNKGWFALQLASSHGELPGVEVSNVRLDPARLPAGGKGVLRLAFSVDDCSAALRALGMADPDTAAVATDDSATAARLSVTTSGPLGTTTTPFGGFADLFGDLVGSACGPTDVAGGSS